MIAIFARKREVRIRQDILKEVYEDNLRMIGKKRGRTMAGQRPFFLRKTFLSFAVTIAVILFYGNFMTPSSQTQLPVRSLSVVPADRLIRENPSEYKSLIGGQTHLSRIFGLGVKTIMIDAGHGGADSGTVGKLGTKEKDLTLDIARRLKARLEKTGRYSVVMTRDQDVTVPLHRRVEMATSSRADLFISIHLNYLPSRPINIIETYYFGPSSDAKVLKLAQQENAGSEYGLSDFKEIIGKIGDTFRLQESKELAGLIQKNLLTNLRRENGVAYDFGVKRAPFVVLLGVEVPAVLAEVSCLSNREEELKMNSEAHRENIAHYLEAGVLDYLTKGEMMYEAKRSADR